MGWKRQRKGSEAGYTLALVAVMASVLLVTLSEAVLNWQTAVKREREGRVDFPGQAVPESPGALVCPLEPNPGDASGGLSQHGRSLAEYQQQAFSSQAVDRSHHR